MKKKKEKGKTYMSKDDNGSETAAAAFNTVKPEHTEQLLGSLSNHIEDGYMSYTAHELASKRVLVTWNQNTMCSASLWRKQP